MDHVRQFNPQGRVNNDFLYKFLYLTKTGREEHQRELRDGPGQAGGGGQGGRVEDQPGGPALLCQWRLTGFLLCQLDRILFYKK